MIMNTLLFRPLAALMLVLGAAACTSSNDQPATEPPSTAITLTADQETAIDLQVRPTTQLMLGASIRVNGILEVPPQYLMSITAPFGGRVVKTTILPGTQVRQGATLIVLEDAEFITMQQEYLTVSAELTYAEQELARQQDLATDNVNARRHLEKAESDARVMRVRKRALAEQLAMIGIDAAKLTAENLSRRITLTAPFNGYVTQVYVNTGSAVEPNGKLLELVDPTHLHVELAVFESDAARVREGQSMSVRISGENQPRDGHVHLVGTKIKSDRTVDVHGHLDVADPTLRPGTTVTASIHIEDSVRTAVASEAIVTADGATWVYVKTAPHTYERRRVTPGVEEDGYTEILNHADLQELPVVSKGAHRLSTPSGSDH